MTLGQSLFLLALLVAAGAFFSIAEIAMAASRRLRLRQLAEQGDGRAERVMRVQEQPGHYFTVIQIGVNALGVLGGIVGEGLLSPYFTPFFALWMSEAAAGTAGFLAAFLLVTSLFILGSDLAPKRVSMAVPEKVAVRIIGPMLFLMTVLKPVVWLYAKLTDLLMALFKLPQQRDETITSDDILALTEAGALSGALERREQQVIENVFELDTRTVPSSMTAREHIAYFLIDDPDEVIRARIAKEPYAAYPVCEKDIDHVIGYVEARDLFQRVLNGRPIHLRDNDLVRKALVLPDRLTLAEVLDQFRLVGQDFAIIVNEYSLVVGLITLNDVMSTVMGGLVHDRDDDMIVRRDENSWLIDGITPIQDVQRVLEIDTLLHEDEYETLAGFLMVMLRRVPRRTDSVTWGGYKFEVMDVDSYRIDQVLVTRFTPPAEGEAAEAGRPPAAPADARQA
ncbi:HlyC/CorC family transporter [Verticiella sediminum]|uniref:Polyamine export protein n=1 Tax=Verticiella sediminum TaxID=1247510 RepID=A0A556AYF4_9BURK|nr:hemolysin family protein [Verticiella sediminum]TSH97969.1 HlyC/CorC family transporter [Verticiella sediminum]